MDIYLTSLALGGVGLVAMAASGLGQHGHGGHAGDGGHAGHDVGHVGGHGHAGHGHAGHGHAGHGHSGHDTHATGGSHPLLSLMSPRLLFSVSLGLGTTGVILQRVLPDALHGITLFAAAAVGGVLFERLLVRPLWNALFRFESNPALTLESALSGEATAVSNFDTNGQGLIAIEMDGQMVQLLGTLQSDDRAMRIRVAAGTRLRIEEVDAARNRCTVSLL